MTKELHERNKYEDLAFPIGLYTVTKDRILWEIVNLLQKKTEMFESPNQYLLKYRIFRSVEYLKRTDMSVTEIAMTCGFNDTSHFIQYFKKKMGVTPYEYRATKC